MKRRERGANLLIYGFVISLAMHALLLPFVRPSSGQAEETAQPFDFRRATPPPAARPTLPPLATPHPLRRPPPLAVARAPREPIALQRPAAGPRAAGPATSHRSAPGGVPRSPGDGADAGGTAAAVAAPATILTATPQPLACARPNVPAATLRAAEPELPALAQQEGIAGTVDVVVSLDAASRVIAARVARSPSALLNAVALAAARGSEFRTETRDCVPVAADYVFRVDFVPG